MKRPHPCPPGTFANHTVRWLTSSRWRGRTARRSSRYTWRRGRIASTSWGACLRFSSTTSVTTLSSWRETTWVSSRSTLVGAMTGAFGSPRRWRWDGWNWGCWSWGWNCSKVALKLSLFFFFWLQPRLSRSSTFFFAIEVQVELKFHVEVWIEVVHGCYGT